MNDKIESLIGSLAQIGNEPHLLAIRDGIAKTSPFTITGSLFMIIANFPVEAWADFIDPYYGVLSAMTTVTFSCLGLISAIGIGYYMAEQFEINKSSNMLLVLVGFLLATLNSDLAIDIDSFGATGMFTAIVVAIFVTHVYRFCLKSGFVISLPAGVPPSVATSFTSLIPAAICLTSIWVFRCVAGVNLNDVVSVVFSPLVVGLGTLPGMMLYSLLALLLWVCGIHGDNVLSGIVDPIWLAMFAENVAAWQVGQPIPNIFCGNYWIVFMCLGGTGSTLGLVLNMVVSRCKMYRELGKMSLPSAIFCINEPVVFGFPIVANPIMAIPFIVTPMVLCVGTYFLMYFNLIGRLVMDVPWTMPPIIGAYFATGGSWTAAAWSAISIVIAVLIYRPFFKVEEKRQLEIESAASGEGASAADPED